MTYHRKTSLGDIAGTITTAASVINDPYFNEAVCLAGQLRSVERGEPAIACSVTPANLGGGAGLRSLMPAMRTYSFAQRNKWVYPLAIAALLGIPAFVGYELGKKHR